MAANAWDMGGMACVWFKCRKIKLMHDNVEMACRRALSGCG